MPKRRTHVGLKIPKSRSRTVARSKRTGSLMTYRGKRRQRAFELGQLQGVTRHVGPGGRGADPYLHKHFAASLRRLQGSKRARLPRWGEY